MFTGRYSLTRAARWPRFQAYLGLAGSPPRGRSPGEGVTTDRPDPRDAGTPSAPSRPAAAPTQVARRFVSLQTKFLVGTLFVVASVMSALVLIVEHRQREAIIREVQRRGDALARDLATVSTGPLVLYSYTQLEQNVARLAVEADVAYAMILDRDGRVAAHDHRTEIVGTVLSGSALDRILSTEGTLTQEIDRPDGEALYDFAVPIRVDSQRWGTARVGLSRRRMEAEIAATRRQLIGLAILVLGGAGLASALVARRIARPVRQLAAGAVAISRGELVQRVEPTTSDEIGQLAAAFNNMARQLHEQRSALIEQRSALEAAHGELRQHFAELSDLKSYTDHILDSLVNGIVTLDLDGRVITLNGAAESLLGCPPVAAARGRHVTEVLAHAPELVATLQAAIQWRTGRTGTVTLPGRLGNVVPVEITTATLKGGEGQDLGVIAIVRDLTAVRALEAQLRHAQKMEAVGRLAGGVAHDFNNLLTVITGRSQLLLLKLPPESPLRRDVELVEETAHRASALTRQLLAFSRKQMVQPRVVDLNEIVRGMETMLSRLIGEDISLATRLDPTAGCVRADPAQLEQMIVNLAVNARDAMPLGGRLTLETSFVRLDESFARQYVGLRAGPHVRLTVRDTGVGMDGLIKTHLFEPFFTTKGPGKGTGLGLATVYGIVTQSGGAIRVESEPGQGAAFTIDLPRVDAPADARGDLGIPTAAPHGSETVLLVEDEPEVRRLARDILHEQGYTVLEAADGDDALKIGREHGGPIHLLVTDVVMPQMGGRELADRLTAGRSETKVLYVSGYTDDAILHQGVSETGTAFLPKPFTAWALSQKVREVLDAAPATGAR
jgi:PAS domain S-box-containing protein